MDLSSRTAMELHFADNFETHLFSVLAEHYLKDGDLDRARKVCKIGLEYHPENADGLFILGKTDQTDGELKKAEQSFKSVLKNGTIHLQAATNLAKIQTELDRSDTILHKTWQQILKWDPRNKTARVPEMGDCGFWCSAPYDKARLFFHSKPCILAREKAKKGFFL